MFEQTEVFERGVGEVTDIVEKELFRLQPRTEDAEAWALRPEATAGIVRAYVQHGMQTWPQPVKVALVGPMFRYDRPQAGRHREFWQWDVEAIGDLRPAVDAELVELAAVLPGGGPRGRGRAPELDRDQECRPPYLAELVADYREQGILPGGRATPPGGQPAPPARLEGAPAWPAINAKAPRLADRLCDACAEHFAAVRAHLDTLGIPYRSSRRLCAAWTTTRERRSSTTGAAQRASNRRSAEVELRRPGRDSRRPSHVGIGFALGIDRTSALAGWRGPEWGPAPARRRRGYDPAATAERLRLATMLRAEGLAVRADLGTRKLGASWKAPAARVPTSRSSSATSSLTGTSSCATSRRGRSARRAGRPGPGAEARGGEPPARLKRAGRDGAGRDGGPTARPPSPGWRGPCRRVVSARAPG